MNPNTTLKTARNLFKKGDFALAVRLLEKEVFHFRANPDYYLLLSLCYLRLNNTKTAKTYLESAQNLEANSAEIQQAGAILDIARGNSEKALTYWLGILDEDPDNFMAQNGLEMLRIHSQDPLSAWINSQDFLSLYPLPKLHFTQRAKKTQEKASFSWEFLPVKGILAPLGSFLKGLLLLIVVGLLGFLFVFLVSGLYTTFKTWSLPKRSGIDVIMISPEDLLLSNRTSSQLVEEGEEPYRYDLTPDEVMQLFSMTKDAFNAYEDNVAQMNINRLLLSNASEDVKRKAYSLSQFTSQPTFGTFKKGPTFQEVSRDPLLYENVYVLWRGRITNLQEEPNGFVFDLMVGYTDSKLLEGIVLSRMTFDTFLENGMNVDLIAQIKNHMGVPPFYLRVTSLHRLES